MIFFTSDLHLGHSKVIEFCARPFKSVEEMDRTIIKRYNLRVKSEDIVYFLGDVCFHKAAIGIPLLQKLNGIKILIQGNHDKWSDTQYRQAGFSCILREARIKAEGHHFVLSHYPYWDESESDPHDRRYQERRPINSGKWLLNGHVHEKWKTKDKQINVGVDQWNFQPVSIKQVDFLVRQEENKK